MKSDFATIEREADEQLAREESGAITPAMRASSRKVDANLYGFKMPGELAEEIQVDEIRSYRKSVISNYRRHAAELRVTLMTHGVEPLAVLPARAWARICFESGLYRMSPFADGCIHVNSSVIQSMRASSKTGVGHFAAWAVAGLFTAVAAAFYVYSGFAFDHSAWFFALVPYGIVAALSVRLAYDLVSERVEKGAFQRNVNKYLAGRTYAQVLDDLSNAERNFDGNTRVLVELPEPPVDVARTMLKLKGNRLHVCVAAEAGAIAFKGGVAKMFMDANTSMLAYEEALRRDPIIYVDNRSHDRNTPDVVAVIAQFGDFPIEQEVVRRVLASEHLV